MQLREWLKQGPFSLAMSSGFFGFYAHCGFLSVLEEEGIRPVQLHGSSAGALIAGLWASGLPTATIRDVLFQLERRDFWDPGMGAGLLKGIRFEQILKEHLKVARIEECPIPLQVTAFDVNTRRSVSLHQGCLATALRASCAVPLLFHPVKMAGRRLLDGGIADRPGILGASESERILYHHLVPSRFWRAAPSSCIPKRAGLQSVEIKGLPKLGPFRLAAGRDAYQQARQATQQLMSLPVGEHLSVTVNDAIESRSQPVHDLSPSHLS
jgi:NTE family protein